MEAQHTILPIRGARCSALRCSVCANASATLKHELSRLARIRTYRAGETVLAEAEEMGFVGNVVSGVLRMQKTLHDGRQQIVGLLLPSDMFGRVFARRSHVAIEAATDVTLCCYNRASFEGLLLRFPEIEHRMFIAMSHELDAAQDWMLLLATQSVTERVATFLLILSNNQGMIGSRDNRAASFIQVPIARKDMAAYLGTTVESISRSIRQMGRGAVIRIIDAQRFEILNLRRLLTISGHDLEDFAPPNTQLQRAG
ncbi:Crp/Fnr family transcriptional regulator [Martelella soudanensis]|uniref:Crp/Fnr family transcriptional regulator n=1 Tax=unclassified Martelella TaxID=2629616 RepID=UPI0015DE59AA|nr:MULTISPECIES: Crp/Fnr family transcriptional regulator [unclassified Martelella]